MKYMMLSISTIACVLHGCAQDTTTCDAQPACDEGDQSVSGPGDCLQGDASCYEVENCGQVTWCTGEARTPLEVTEPAQPNPSLFLAERVNSDCPARQKRPVRFANLDDRSRTIVDATAGPAGFGFVSAPEFPLVIPPQSEASFEVEFLPEQEGTVNGELCVVELSGLRSCVETTGLATATEAVVSHHPFELDFGDQPVGVESASIELRIALTDGGDPRVLHLFGDSPNLPGGPGIHVGKSGAFPLSPCEEVRVPISWTPSELGPVPSDVVVFYEIESQGLPGIAAVRVRGRGVE